MGKIIPGVLLTILLVAGLSQAHAELTIWQVENNPPGIDSGNEWLTLINLGESDTFNGYGIKTTHGRIASYPVPSITLNTCEYHKMTLPRQAIDNENDTVKLRKHGTTIYETPIIKDTRNDDRFWTNPDVAAICDDPYAAPAEPIHEYDSGPPDEMTLEQRIQALEERADEMDTIIGVLLESVALLWAEIEAMASIIMTIQETIDALFDGTS